MSKQYRSPQQPDFFNEGFNIPSMLELPIDIDYFPGLALNLIDEILSNIAKIVEQSPLRRMQTYFGHQMSVAMTNCGPLGWISDRYGYKYSNLDPLTGVEWPKMPKVFLELASQAAAKAGYPNFIPDACLINQYQPGAKMSLHQDKDEKDLSAPIVSVSFGLSALFQIGGTNKKDRLYTLQLNHGDVIVWGKSLRLAYHSILPLKSGVHPLLGPRRINLTFRKVF